MTCGRWSCVIYLTMCNFSLGGKFAVSSSGDYCIMSECSVFLCFIDTFSVSPVPPAGQWLDTESRYLMTAGTTSPFSPVSSTGCWTDMTTGYVLGWEVSRAGLSGAFKVASSPRVCEFGMSVEISVIDVNSSKFATPPSPPHPKDNMLRNSAACTLKHALLFPS